MTARELRLLLESIPDDTPVIVTSDAIYRCQIDDVELETIAGRETLSLRAQDLEPADVHMYPASRYLQ